MAQRRAFDRYYAKPQSCDEIARIAETLLVRGQCVDVLPTPIERLFEIARVEELVLPAPDERGFLTRLQSEAQQAFKIMVQKVRGAADLRRRVVYITPNDSKPRTQFVRGHELGHQVLPWHTINGGYVDDNTTLSQAVREVFEAEANLFSSEINFQGRYFLPRARDYRPSFSSVFELARLHGASYHATFWRFVEGQDSPTAGLIFYPSDIWDSRTQLPIFRLWKVVRSPSFERRFGCIQFDDVLHGDHPWIAGFVNRSVAESTMNLVTERSKTTFMWESWWNCYALFVMLRKRPTFHFVGQVLTSNKN